MDSFDSEDDDDLIAAVAVLDGETGPPATDVHSSIPSTNHQGPDSEIKTEKKDLELSVPNPELSALDPELSIPDLESSFFDTELSIPDPQLSIPDSFPFPFTPYNIQTDFMRSLYTCLELGKIGIFESPTGTGKSLSLICGALKWLRDFQAKQKRELEELLGKSSSANISSATVSQQEEPDWIREFVVKKEKEEKVAQLKNEQQHIEKREAKLKELQNSTQLGSRKRKRKSKQDLQFEDLMQGASEDIRKACMSELQVLESDQLTEGRTRGDDGGGDDDDDHLLVADYRSDDESSGGIEDKDAKDDEEEKHVTKIYYCSRTHSQLSQFVREIIKSPFEDVRVVSLGSRQNMCINPSVRKLSSLALINDRCLELQQKKSKKKPGCPYHKQEVLETLKDKTLLEVADIEQLVASGREMKACPYYAARYAIPLAEIVALPYNTLLHRQTRTACGIKLAGSIVIIDEAHNLLETINSVHSVEITAAQVVRAHSQLSQYEKKFRSRLKAKNLLYVRQILFVLSHLAEVMGGSVDYTADSQTNSKEDVSLLTINNFLFRSRLDNFNMFKLLRYCQRSQISKKLHGFVEKYQDTEVKAASKTDPPVSGVTRFLQEIQASKSRQASLKSPAEVTDAGVGEQPKLGYMSSPLMQIESFLDALTTADQDGRVVVSKQVKLSQSSLKFLMLNPAVHFISILQEARAVVVAGGTMQPVSEFKDQLFQAAGMSPGRVLEFSCGHIIPGSQILPMSVAKGPTGIPLDFTYQSRDKIHVIEELGRILCNVCAVVPGGIVCFFPSYDYEQAVFSAWDKSGLLQKIQTKKTVFREPKRSGLAEHVLAEYSTCIKRCATWQGSLTGAVLMSVVGGKMSEGINFSDDLGRCVMMVGLPYPNINSPELKEKMSYLNATFPRGQDGKEAGQMHYENLCMKAVNQSIGRAIRHRNDHASILLLDQRYLRASVTSMLPQWISKHLQSAENFAAVMKALPKFFNSHKTKP